MADHRVIYGDDEFTFSVNHRNELTHKVAIHVQPDRRIIVDAPTGASLLEIKKALLKRARLIHRQLAELGEAHRHTLPRQYVSGETHWYLGKRYLLKVYKGQQEQTKLVGGTLVVRVCDQSTERVPTQLNEWYQRQATMVFERRLNTVLPKMQWIQQQPQWQLRNMNKQWGSCSPQGRLSLNPKLVKAPRQCIDYVIIHELCHLKHHNHSDAFYRLLPRHCPGWEAVKQRLDNLAEQILT